MFQQKQVVSRNRFFMATAFSAVVLAGMYTFQTQAQSQTQCYQLASLDVPWRDTGMAPDLVTWCYRSVESPRGSRLVYQVDRHGVTKPELSLLVESDGTITHASLKAGVQTVHRLESGFNPINAPLTPPPGAKPIPAPVSLASAESVEGALELFQTVSRPKVVLIPVTEGEYSAAIAPELMPWRGYWFPHSSGRMHRGEQSPLAKFDKFVARRAAVNPGAQSWEARRHGYSGLNWAGHCNGWAAASVLRSEPKAPITDPYTGITFSVSDQKALWSERDYCPDIAFFGHRNWGNPGDNPRDIQPQVFHNVITYYIGTLKKPILVDYMASAPVENRVVSGYSIKIKETAKNTFRVEAVLTIHEYDKQIVDEPGVAPTIEKTYRYTLRTDSNGQIQSGSWISANPDFFWVPLAPAECAHHNPAVEEFWINELLRVGITSPEPSHPDSPVPPAE